MTATLDERILKAKERVAKLEQQQRAEARRKREEAKKNDQRRYYIIGELVAKYFPEVLLFDPGTKAENAIEFEPLETVLSALAADKELIKQLITKPARNTSAVIDKQTPTRGVKPLRCVSGRAQKYNRR